LLLQAEERHIHGLVDRHGVSDALGAVSDELGRGGGTIAVDGLGVPALRRVGRVLRCGETHHIRPLLQRLLVYPQELALLY
jgi:hypothetical protein